MSLSAPRSMSRAGSHALSFLLRLSREVGPPAAGPPAAGPPAGQDGSPPSGAVFTLPILKLYQRKASLLLFFGASEVARQGVPQMAAFVVSSLGKPSLSNLRKLPYGQSSVCFVFFVLLSVLFFWGGGLPGVSNSLKKVVAT